MARLLRLDQPGLTHHITARGNNRKKIFRDDADCLEFLELLGQAATLFNWVVYSWVLMLTHYHLVIETPEPTPSDGMHWLNFRYAQHVNRRHKRSGRVVQGRRSTAGAALRPFAITNVDSRPRSSYVQR